MKRLLFSLLLLLVLVPLGMAQEEDALTAPDVSPALIEQLEDLEARTVNLRGLTALAPVERGFPSRDELAVFLQNLIEEELTAEDIFIDTIFYRALGFVGADFDLEQAYLDLLVDQVAGFYDTETQMMNVVLIGDAPLGDRLPLLEQVTYVHEYVHALQDQYFDLAALQEAVPEDNPDAILALTSLIEGDATAAMTDFLLEIIVENPLAALEILMMDIDASLPASVPPILEAELTVPYFAGQTFVDALRSEGGWQAVDAAFANPPVSMSQIFDPQRYIAGILPFEVRLVDVAPLLGDDWEFVTERTIGIFYWREYLKLKFPARTAEDTMRGWAGDRFAVYYNAQTDEIAWVAQITWDTAEARDDFQLALSVESAIVGERDIVFASAPTLALAESIINAQQTVPES